MKQHITVEQLNELSENGKKVWASFINGVDKPWDGGSYILIEDENDISWCSNIGKMIEFLDEYAKKENNDFDIRLHSAGSGWMQPGQRLVDIYGLPVSEIEDEPELADALWEACREILEKK